MDMTSFAIGLAVTSTVVLIASAVIAVGTIIGWNSGYLLNVQARRYFRVAAYLALGSAVGFVIASWLAVGAL